VAAARAAGDHGRHGREEEGEKRAHEASSPDTASSI
jgi:hypothetical protein